MKRWKPCAAAVAAVVIGSLVTTGAGSYAADEGALADRNKAETDRSSLHGRLGLAPGERLVLKDVIRDADGTVHKRYDRTYRNLPVVAGDVIVHQSPAGRIGVDWATRADLTEVAGVQPRVSAATASRVAARTTQLSSHTSDAELVVYAVGDEARLAWQATASGAATRELVFVDAVTGIRIAGWSDLH
ncbi:MAG: hypothetical protein ACRDO2_15375, partial [Nocardioidaceae bacterium]